MIAAKKIIAKINKVFICVFFIVFNLHLQIYAIFYLIISNITKSFTKKQLWKNFKQHTSFTVPTDFIDENPLR